MPYKNRVAEEYFEWMFDLVCGNRYAKSISYRKLLTHLHNTEFVYSIKRDKNRAEDGVDLRYRFGLLQDYGNDIYNYLDGPCSVLEMLVALSIRCEENIMDDPLVGNRTGQWFWGMISNLGLGSMIDSNFNEEYIDDILGRFFRREYEPNGTGGLFTIRNCEHDLRNVEIWYQLCWYLDSIV